VRQSPHRRQIGKTAHRPLKAWKLQDAKAHFSQLVREAQQQGPKRVTLHGKDAVVILSAEDYARFAPAAAQPACMHCCLNRPCETWTSSTRASAARCATLNCEGLAA
jgi:prevent-host-death family protein